MNAAQVKKYWREWGAVKRSLGSHCTREDAEALRVEITRKVETAQGISKLGEQKVSYNSTLENLEVTFWQNQLFHGLAAPLSSWS